MSEENQIIEEAQLIEVIENQLEDGNPVKVKEVVEGMVGTHHISVPAYAAVKVGGTPLYKMARRGKKVPNVMRDMEVLEALFTGVVCENGNCIISCTLTVSSGTYIRSLAEELGRRLGYPGTLAALRRTRVGEVHVADAIRI